MDTSVQDTERNIMWTSILGDAYFVANKTTKRKMRMNYAKEQGTTVGNINYNTASTITPEIKTGITPGTYITLANITPASVGVAQWKISAEYQKATAQMKKKEEAMYQINAETVAQDQRNAISSWLYDTNYTKTNAMQREFNLIDDKAPRMGQELVDRIMAGKYVLETYEDAWGEKADRLKWRDPAKPADKPGYDTALAAKEEAYTKTMRTIVIKSPDEGLAAFEAFENTTFH